ncbi:DUF3419 family protein [Limoniibacter endophyticus]|uniref:S-adenosylmethionine--diacylglycerol 3-amino-3-carboxypropyl transferase n=1 Tax=Limoniibacter endophyticus TaxID=1565040 RepID=A0A8J3GJ01_9HYPH|nr:DUF3419 family protein [Limoniibacter endophyticus]GHC75122.1 S-adenosylmethionine--diacylglycerol 3-amino-3-carboxypropyl transferase [Limoniibacter endophyticus]
MSDISITGEISNKERLGRAVHQNRLLSKAGLSERLFTLLFSGLVYPQIWEDPIVDMDAMALDESHSMVVIASGGCNVLSYLTRQPARIDAVDLNAAHIALNKMKLSAVKNLPDQKAFFRFFGANGVRGNAEAYDLFLKNTLDADTRAYWESRNWKGQRRICVFERNFYQTGLLGFFIGTAHRLAKLHGVDPAKIMQSRTLAEQRDFFRLELKPILEKPLLRWLCANRASLFGLGIPPAQYEALLSSGERGMADVLATRLEKLSCHFPLKDNYFAWQAFARRYAEPGEAKLPPYLEAENFETIRAHADRVHIHHLNFVELLQQKPANSVDRYVLLDAQDWMTDDQLNTLWNEITRSAAPGARVIFRTANEPSLLPGRVDADTLAQWRYFENASRAFGAADRSGIYGGFHLYEKI